MIAKQFPKNLSALMAHRKLSQNDVARLSGVSQTYVGYLMRGEKVPTIQTIEKLAKGFRIHPWQLIAPTDMIDWDERLLALIKAFNRASPEGRESILDTALAAAKPTRSPLRP